MRLIFSLKIVVFLAVIAFATVPGAWGQFSNPAALSAMTVPQAQLMQAGGFGAVC